MRQERLDEHMGDGAPERRPFSYDVYLDHVRVEKDRVAWAFNAGEAKAWADSVARERWGGRARVVLVL